MLDAETIDRAAHALDQAEQSAAAMPQLTLTYPGLTIEDAYAIQKSWVDMKLARGCRVIGHKIGLTSRAMQQAVGIDEPDYGVLLRDMLYEEREPIPCARFITPRVEVELAFILDKDLEGPECTVFDVMGATRYVVPAIEVIDTRIQRIDPESGRVKRIGDNIADNAGNAALVLGTSMMRPMDVDLRWVHALCYRNGQIEESGVSAAVLNHPASGVAWLARKLWAHGDKLKAGETVLSGSFIRPVDARPGDVFHVDLREYGSVTCRFV